MMNKAFIILLFFIFIYECYDIYLPFIVSRNQMKFNCIHYKYTRF